MSKTNPTTIPINKTMTERFGYGPLVETINAATGLKFALGNSGGGCMVFDAEMQTPSGLMFVAITESGGFIREIGRRTEHETPGNGAGWLIGIYANDPDPQYGDCRAEFATSEVWHEYATLDDLPRLLSMALELAPGEHVAIRRELPNDLPLP